MGIATVFETLLINALPAKTVRYSPSSQCVDLNPHDAGINTHSVEIYQGPEKVMHNGI